MPSSAVVTKLLDSYPLISDQVDRRELAVILSELEKVIRDDSGPSAVVEFGCYIGTTSLFIRRLLDALTSNATFHVYDSFIGLPTKTDKDNSPAGEQFREGELSVSRKDFERQFKKAGLRTPTIHKAWFSDLTVSDIPAAIRFAYLDGDFYESIRDSLHLIESKLMPGSVIVVDDYANEALPGAAKAVDEWIRSKGLSARVAASLAIIRI